LTNSRKHFTETECLNLKPSTRTNPQTTRQDSTDFQIDLWLSYAPSTYSDKQSTFGDRRYGSCHSRRHFTGGNWWVLETERVYIILKSPKGP